MSGFRYREASRRGVLVAGAALGATATPPGCGVAPDNYRFQHGGPGYGQPVSAARLKQKRGLSS